MIWASGSLCIHTLRLCLAQTTCLDINALEIIFKLFIYILCVFIIIFSCDAYKLFRVGDSYSVFQE